MTDRLYYNDPYSREFDATVTRVATRGDQQAVWLDRTSFYPTTGGQPFDTGTLNESGVDEVIEDEAGDIVHLIAARQALLREGERVRGVIDWMRRFDHMQQHTGQHVLSAAFDRLFQARTMSFHLGSGASTIDLAREMTPVEIAAAEEAANRIVWEDRAVVIRYATAEEAARMPLRKEPVREGTLRLIEVEGFDLSACGGTHVARTGAIGVIAVSAWERFKGGQRLEFVCGGRALSRFRGLRDAVTASLRLLSVLPDELPDAVARLQAELKEQKRTSMALEVDLARYRADELCRDAEPHALGRLVLRVVDADATGLKTLATAVASRPGMIVVLVTPSRPALMVAARSADLGISCRDLVTKLMSRCGGRGGGKPDLAQAGGIDANGETLLVVVREVLSS